MNIKTRLEHLEAAIAPDNEAPLAIFITAMEPKNGQPRPLPVLGWRSNSGVEVRRLDNESDEELEDRASKLGFDRKPGCLALLFLPII